MKQGILILLTIVGLSVAVLLIYLFFVVSRTSIGGKKVVSIRVDEKYVYVLMSDGSPWVDFLALKSYVNGLTMFKKLM